MNRFYYKFKTKKSINGVLFPLYGLMIFFCWILYSCVSEYEKLGYFIIHNRYLVSKYSGKEAIQAISFMRYMVSLILTISLYYTISAFLSLKHKTMYDVASKMEYVSCAVCSEPFLSESENYTMCSNCRSKANEFRSAHKVNESANASQRKPRIMTFEDNEREFNSVFIKFAVVIGVSIALAFAINTLL